MEINEFNDEQLTRLSFSEKNCVCVCVWFTRVVLAFKNNRFDLRYWTQYTTPGIRPDIPISIDHVRPERPNEYVEPDCWTSVLTHMVPTACVKGRRLFLGKGERTEFRRQNDVFKRLSPIESEWKRTAYFNGDFYRLPVTAQMPTREMSTDGGPSYFVNAGIPSLLRVPGSVRTLSVVFVFVLNSHCSFPLLVASENECVLRRSPTPGTYIMQPLCRHVTYMYWGQI